MSTRLDWRDVARMPWDLFAGSMDWLCRTALPPGPYEQRYREGGGSSSSTSHDEGNSSRSGDYTVNYSRNHAWETESSGTDTLCNDDIKVVNYKVVFTKPNNERVLTSGEDIIGYRTDLATYSGLKIARYLERNSEAIPEEDQHYIRVHVDVIHHYAKEREDFDQKRVDLMEREVNILSTIEKEIAGNHRRAA